MTGRTALAQQGAAWVRWAAWLLAGAGFLGLFLVGSDRPVNSRLSCSAEPGASGVPGFGESAFQIRPGANLAPPTTRSAPLCGLLASTPAQQARGMMGRRDLAGYDGMVFRFPADTSVPFYNRDVPIPLSVAWFAADGTFVGTTDMAPCADQSGCPQFPPPASYRYALETPQGGLPRLGVGTGSVLTLLR